MSSLGRQLRALLSLAVTCVRSHDVMYDSGLNWANGGPFSLTISNFHSLDTDNELRVDPMIWLTWLKPRSHAAVDTTRLYIDNVSGNKRAGTTEWQ